MTTTAFERFTTRTAPVPPTYQVTVRVACWAGRADLAKPFCSKSCAITRYTKGPDGFLIHRLTLPGYVSITCPGCGLDLRKAGPISERTPIRRDR